MQISITTIVVESDMGASVHEAIRDALRLAVEHESDVELVHNDTRVYIDYKRFAEDAHAQWNSARELSAPTPIATPGPIETPAPIATLGSIADSPDEDVPF